MERLGFLGALSGQGGPIDVSNRRFDPLPALSRPALNRAPRWSGRIFTEFGAERHPFSKFTEQLQQLVNLSVTFRLAAASGVAGRRTKKLAFGCAPEYFDRAVE
jgi:hypothetical protein